MQRFLKPIVVVPILLVVAGAVVAAVLLSRGRQGPPTGPEVVTASGVTVRPVLDADGGVVKIPVQFLSEPEGATVTLNDHKLGVTPVTVPFPVGLVFEVLMNKEGYGLVKRRFTVTGEPGQRVGAKLPPM